MVRNGLRVLRWVLQGDVRTFRNREYDAPWAGWRADGARSAAQMSSACTTMRYSTDPGG